MHDYSYSAHLVINDGYEDRLDMKISCQNAQQLLRARDSFSDQMNTYIAEFAMQSNLVRMPNPCPPPQRVSRPSGRMESKG